MLYREVHTYYTKIVEYLADLMKLSSFSKYYNKKH